MKSANSAIRMNGTRIASGSNGSSRASPPQRCGTPANSRGATATAETLGSSRVETMAHLLGQANAGIDISVEDVDDEVDAGQCQHRDQRVLEGVDRNHRVAG